MDLIELDILPKVINFNHHNREILLVNNFANSEINVNGNSEIYIVAITNKGWEEKKKIKFNLIGENASIHFFGLIFGDNSHKFPFETISTHKAANTRAYYYIRSSMFDKSEINYRGNLIIPKNSRMTDAYLAHHTLMLSKNVKTETVPCLEIEADDVKAGHAATIGNVDEDMLFYFQSRGIDKEKAKRIMIKGFMEADLNKIPQEKAKKELIEKIEKKFKKYLDLQ